MKITEAYKNLASAEKKVNDLTLSTFKIFSQMSLDEEGKFVEFVLRCEECLQTWKYNKTDDFWLCPNGCNKNILKDRRRNDVE
jgi:hypothetical protein